MEMYPGWQASHKSPWLSIFPKSDERMGLKAKEIFMKKIVLTKLSFEFMGHFIKKGIPF